MHDLIRNLSDPKINSNIGYILKSIQSVNH